VGTEVKGRQAEARPTYSQEEKKTPRPSGWAARDEAESNNHFGPSSCGFADDRENGKFNNLMGRSVKSS
jgi:hypothetical protein